MLAVEDAANVYFEAGEAEAEKAAEAARDQRERAAAELRRAHEMVVSAIDDFEGLAWLAALAGWIEEQRLAADVEPAPVVRFGWAGGTQPPGSMRVS